jgi:putative membrane-bound dehydrogenase-like protein
MLALRGSSCVRLALTTVLAVAGCTRKTAEPPYSPQQSIAMMRLAEGYGIEPFAAEPSVVSPVAMDIDEDGRIYVVEDRGYPLEVKGRIGRVKLLEDTDGDGKPDRTSIFADDLVMPTGVMRWRKGILVTDPPYLWYLEDTNGDGKADVRKKVLSGFAFTNPQHTVNSPVYGLDNWIYLAHENPTTAIIFQNEFGDRGSDISFEDRPQVALKERGRSIRFRPDTFEIEALSGSSQFGHAFDDFGRHFVLNNTYHARHEVIAAQYLKRNPDLPVLTATQDISDHGMPAKVYPIVPKTRFEMLTNIGEFTSACGLTFWRGGAFVAEPAHNLVHRDTYSAAGATFKASRDRDSVEFLASRDPWFRPVNFYVGPDGALYMMDFYRLVIEHPEWISTEAFRATKDLTAGIDRGRIYRITAGNMPAPKPIRLSTASTAELVKHLANDNPWWRRTAQRLLVDRKAADALPMLSTMAASDSSPVARVHALWTLEGLGRLESASIEKALQDPAAGVRENAIQLAESRIGKDSSLVQRLLSMDKEPDPRVRFQLLCTLGFVSTPAAQKVRDGLLASGFDDRWMQTAALSASPEEAGRLFATAVRQAAPASFIRQAAAVIGVRRKPDEMQRVLASVSTGSRGEWRSAALEGLATGLRGKGVPVPDDIKRRLLRLFEEPDAGVRRGALHVLQSVGLSGGNDTMAAVRRAEQTANDRKADTELRADAIGLLAISDVGARRATLEQLVTPAEPEPVQIAAVRAIGYIPGPETAQFLLKHWRGLTANVRMEAADALYRDPNRVPIILDALKNGSIQPWTLAFRHRRQLVMHRDPAIRDAARALLESGQSERAKVIAQYQPALDKSADAARGKTVFKNVCAKCHKLDNVGAEVGPDLATVRHEPKQVLLTSILDPSQSISQGFEAYVVETMSGATLDGVLGGQTASTVTLKHEEGKEDTIQRKDIKNMYATNLSAMPADLEKQVDVQQMADLLEYLKSAGHNAAGATASAPPR